MSALLAALAACAALSACGGGERQDVAEPSGNFPVQVTIASFPRLQKLSEHTRMVIRVKNVGRQAIPNLAVTVCNVTCAYPAPPGQGSSSSAFASNLSENYLASPSRPVWIVDRPPGSCVGSTAYSCAKGGAGAYASAYTNTWVHGPLASGASATFRWAVTAVDPGVHTVAWAVAAGLNGKAKAVAVGGGSPSGQFRVAISRRPSKTYVNNAGQIRPQRLPSGPG